MRCAGCGENKSAEEFPRDSSSKSGRASRCKPCHNKRNREYVERQQRGRHYHLKQRYGLSADEVEERASRQSGLCTICRSNPAEQVDHDHRSGRPRGILCLDCNAGLGAFRDDVRLIYEAVDYLHPVDAEEWIGK